MPVGSPHYAAAHALLAEFARTHTPEETATHALELVDESIRNAVLRTREHMLKQALRTVVQN